MPDYYRDYQIYCNGKRVGSIERDAEMSFYIDAEAEIVAKIDWCRSQKFKIDKSFSDDIKLEVFPTARGWRMLIYLYYISFGYRKYLTLQLLKT
jgi:hypothetical protein